MENGPMKIVFTNMPFKYFPGAAAGNHNYFRPQLSIAYLAAYLREYSRVPVEISLIDCAPLKISALPELEKRIVEIGPDVVGLTVATATRGTAGDLALRLKERLPGVITVMGGPHISAMPDEPAPGVDALFFGEGEAALAEYLDKIILGGMDTPVPGCNQLSGGKVSVPGGPRPLIDPLDNIPVPAWDLMNGSSLIHSYPQKYSTLASMFTSRGCPFNCSFCGNRALWGGRVRYHSPERVAAEIDHLVEFVKADLIFIEDDTFLFNRSLASSTMKHIRSCHPRLRWICHTRADTLDRETVDEMKHSGCVEVQIGVESGDQAILDSCGKQLKVDDIRNAFSLLKKAGVKGWGTFIIGNSGESRETIYRTIDFALDIDPAYASFILLLPFPGTKIYDEYMEKGYIKTSDWSDFSWHGEPVFATEKLSAEDLAKLRRQAWMRFYLRPAKLFSIFMDMLKAGSAKETLRSFRFFLSLVIHKKK